MQGKKVLTQGSVMTLFKLNKYTGETGNVPHEHQSMTCHGTSDYIYIQHMENLLSSKSVDLRNTPS